MFIFDVRIDNLSEQEIKDKTSDFLQEKTFRQIATVNPEFLLRARRDAIFQNLLNRCDLNVADGIGLRFASWYQDEHLKTRFPGVDLMHFILQKAQDFHLKIFLVAREGGLSHWQETAAAITKQYPGLEIDGMNVSIFATESSNEEIESFRKMLDYDIVLCNFGMPYQEMFLADMRNNPGNVRLAMGVGGAFDFITRKRKRAPLWMRRYGLEWLWRLILQPSRIGRIWNAVVAFPIRVFIQG